MSVRFAGYASVFDRVDRGDDVVRGGAFAASLAEGRSVPLLWQHRPGAAIGVIETLAEDARGLRVVARVRYDAGPGVRSEGDVRTLVDFFRARRGAARGFRFRDPFDHDAADQLLGVGDGSRRQFALVKRYGVGDAVQVRAVRLPVAGSVRVLVDGTETAAFVMTDEGEVLLDAAPAIGAEVRAGFLFDVPVRFAEDRLEVSRATFLAGEIASVQMIEVRAPW